MPTREELDYMRSGPRAANHLAAIDASLQKIASVLEEQTKIGGALDFRDVSDAARRQNAQHQIRSMEDVLDWLTSTEAERMTSVGPNLRKSIADAMRARFLP